MDFKIAQIIDHNFAYCAKMFKKYDKAFALFGVIFVCLETNTYFLKKKVDRLEKRLEKKLEKTGTEIEEKKTDEALKTLG